MALAKSIQTPYGVEATYWTIGKISIDRIKLETNILLLWYASKEAEEAKANHISHREFDIKWANESELENISMYNWWGIKMQLITPELIEVFETISKFGYEIVKEQDEFTEATDI